MVAAVKQGGDTVHEGLTTEHTRHIKNTHKDKWHNCMKKNHKGQKY